MQPPKFNKASEAARWIADMLDASNWTKGEMARTAEDRSSYVGSSQAVKFCSLGWIDVADQGFEEVIKNELVDELTNVRGLSTSDNDDDPYTPIWRWNDRYNNTHLEIKETFATIAERLAAKEL